MNPFHHADHDAVISNQNGIRAISKLTFKIKFHEVEWHHNSSRVNVRQWRCANGGRALFIVRNGFEQYFYFMRSVVIRNAAVFQPTRRMAFVSGKTVQETGKAALTQMPA